MSETAAKTELKREVKAKAQATANKPKYVGNRKQRRTQAALHRRRLKAALRMASRGELLTTLANPGKEAGDEMRKLAYAAWHEGLITADQAKLFGCKV